MSAPHLYWRLISCTRCLKKTPSQGGPAKDDYTGALIRQRVCPSLFIYSGLNSDYACAYCLLLLCLSQFSISHRLLGVCYASGNKT